VVPSLGSACRLRSGGCWSTIAAFSGHTTRRSTDDRDDTRMRATHAANERAEIRRAQPGDAAEMARRSGELGYPLPPDEVTRRLDALLHDERHHVAVVAAGERLLAWVHVERRASLEGGEHSCREIDDLYIAGTRLRLRKVTGPSAGVTFKVGKKYGKRVGYAEPITNVYLSEQEYERLAALPGERACKRRYAVCGGSLDVYLEPVAGVAVFEIELHDEGAAASYQPPGFALREITHDEAFSGAALAAAGRSRAGEGE
jgi:CYTH domain-containing protein